MLCHSISVLVPRPTSAKTTFGFSDFVDFAWILRFASNHIQDSLNSVDFAPRD